MQHHGAGLRDLTEDEELVRGIALEPDSHPLGVRERAMVDYALKLTREPAQMVEGDVEALRSAGLDDREILDLAMIVAYYAYVNRLADGLGVALEPGRESVPTKR